MIKKKFDAVKMSLDIKEALYNENKDLSTEEYLKKISNEVKKSPYWKTKSKRKLRAGSKKKELA